MKILQATLEGKEIFIPIASVQAVRVGDDGFKAEILLCNGQWAKMNSSYYVLLSDFQN